MAIWKHVRSVDNPADCATRGYTPEQLTDSALWQNGPPRLSLPESEWPVSSDFSTELAIRKTTTICNIITDQATNSLLLVGWLVRRFLSNTRVPLNELRRAGLSAA